MSYDFKKFSNLSRSQKLELVNVHKKSLPNSPFSLLKNTVCIEIYEYIEMNKNYFQMVVVREEKPIGMFIGRISKSKVNVRLPLKILFSYVKSIILNKGVFFYQDILQKIILLLIKSKSDRIFWIELVFIDQLNQKTKLGTTLLNEYLSLLPLNSKVWVDTERNNKKANLFYLKNEFRMDKSIYLNSLLLVRETTNDSVAN
jgi:hypothetical protein